MNFKQFIRLTILSTFVAWSVWIFLILSIDPVFAGLSELSLFYLTLFLGITGTMLSLMVAARVKLKPETILFRHVVTSFRQSVLLALLVTGSLILLSKNLFGWWSMILFVLLLSLIEWNADRAGKRSGASEHQNESKDSL